MEHGARECVCDPAPGWLPRCGAIGHQAGWNPDDQRSPGIADGRVEASAMNAWVSTRGSLPQRRGRGSNHANSAPQSERDRNATGARGTRRIFGGRRPRPASASSLGSSRRSLPHYRLGSMSICQTWVDCSVTAIETGRNARITSIFVRACRESTPVVYEPPPVSAHGNKS